VTRILQPVYYYNAKFQENPEKMIARGGVRPTRNHFFGYLWQ
jgi:hypothetical protein